MLQEKLKKNQTKANKRAKGKCSTGTLLCIEHRLDYQISVLTLALEYLR